MSLRDVNKDHLAEHMEEPGRLTLVSSGVELPDHQDPLKFWTLHPKENTFVDLAVFALGQNEPSGNGGGTWHGAFSGRPQLIHQLAPAICINLQGKASRTAKEALVSLREWWRVLDAVERDAALAGQPMDRVEDVRQLTRVHFLYASGQIHGMRALQGNKVTTFTHWVNLTLRSMNAGQIHNWIVRKTAANQLRLPPEDQCADLRIALKQEWYAVLKQWTVMDRVMADSFCPTTTEEEDFLKHWRWLQDSQRRTGKVLPTPVELRNGLDDKYFTAKTGLSLVTMRAVQFPSRWEVDAAFHQCLVNTGWNLATLFSLDALTDFLRDNEWDPARYLLIGSKARAGGKEQVVDGLWKTRYGPGYIIKTLLDRNAPLRAQLQNKLAAERVAYERMLQEGAGAEVLTQQLIAIQVLEEGCRNVWLYVDCYGEINWLTHGQSGYKIDGTQRPYLTVFLNRLNQLRDASGKVAIPHVRPKDFRNMFALYVWRISGGNILDVMAALNHAWLKTTDDYLNQNILNEERDAAILMFLNLLFAQLGDGRLDLTILAHQLRYGTVTPEMDQRLAEYRLLPRAWPGIACKDPRHPPAEIHGTSLVPVCPGERCLLCKPNAVILPEALDFVSRRVEELLAYQSAVPITAFQGLPADELANGLLVLRLFPPEAVEKARTRWATAIESGQHRVPGLRPHAEKRIV